MGSIHLSIITDYGQPPVLYPMEKERIKMRVAVPTTKRNEVDWHNGYCERYTLFTIDDNMEIVSSEILRMPQSESNKNSFIQVLTEKQVKTLLVGNMSDGALFILQSNGIHVLRGHSGDTRAVVESYLQKKTRLKKD